MTSLKFKHFLLLAVLITAFFTLYKPLSTSAKVLLFVSQEFPQIPLKPLIWVTGKPDHRQFEIEGGGGKIIADIVFPAAGSHFSHGREKPAVILGMGVKTSEGDKPVILSLADTLARLGYVVVWPRSGRLEAGVADFEEPDVFGEAFEFLEGLEGIDDKRISYVGFSVGSSIMLVSASGEQIADRVRSLVFFGGYFDMREYLADLASGTVRFHGREIGWRPAEGALNHAKEIFATKNIEAALFEAGDRQEAEAILNGISESERRELARFDPKQNIRGLKTYVFILHDKSDTYVPYFESIKLDSAIPEKDKKTFLLINLFEHVQPRREFSPQILGELSRIWLFLYRVFAYL